MRSKETELKQKERELSARETALTAKAQQTASLDSTIALPTRYNDSLPGVWNVQMTCTESSCTGSAVGDSKREEWTFSFEGNRLLARATSGNQLNRVYSGIFTGHTIELLDERQQDAADQSTRMIVRMYFRSASSLEGQREITRSEGCRVVYSLQAEKKI